MFLRKLIIINLLLIKFIRADLVLCENNECRRAGVIPMDSFYSELDNLKEGQQNLTELVQKFNEGIFTLMKLEDIKQIFDDRFNARQDDDDKVNGCAFSAVDPSLYDNLWIVIQTRQDGSVDFYRNWTEYQQGFGDEAGEFFIGLERIHKLTNDRHHELLVILTDFQGTPKFAHYDHFVVGNEADRYRLKELGQYSGTAGNQMKFHLKKFFTTWDKDNDDADEGNCAKWFKGAWWYYNCMTSNLNGPYRYDGSLEEGERGVGVTWGSFDQIKTSYKTTQMLIRAKV